jgi:organic hydroperoxide reductase OsmC/OhrA
MQSDEKTIRVQLTLDRDYRFTATFPESPAIEPLRLDELPPLGAGEGPNPAMLLATAIGNCLAASLLFCLRKARLTVSAMDVSADAHLVRNEAGRYRVRQVDVTLAPTVAGADQARLARCIALFEDFCIVTESVRNGIEVKVDLKPAAQQVRPSTAA